MLKLRKFFFLWRWELFFIFRWLGKWIYVIFILKKVEQVMVDKFEKKFRKNCILKQGIKYRIMLECINEIVLFLKIGYLMLQMKWILSFNIFWEIVSFILWKYVDDIVVILLMFCWNFWEILFGSIVI